MKILTRLLLVFTFLICYDGLGLAEKESPRCGLKEA